MAGLLLPTSNLLLPSTGLHQDKYFHRLSEAVPYNYAVLSVGNVTARLNWNQLMGVQKNVQVLSPVLLTPCNKKKERQKRR